MQTRDQRYAILAHEKVSTIKETYKPDDARPYGAMAHKLPILIRTAGLSQALVFVDARGKDIQKVLLQDLALTLGLNNKEEFLRLARTSSLKEYMLLSRQTLDALLWYKRFAQSILKVKAGDDAGEEE